LLYSEHKDAKRSLPVSAIRIRVGLLVAALVVNLFLAGAFDARSADACCCVGVSPSKQIKMSDAVFSDEVVSIEPSERAPGIFPPSLVASPST
jgi:hypothetical protein